MRFLRLHSFGALALSAVVAPSVAVADELPGGWDVEDLRRVPETRRWDRSSHLQTRSVLIRNGQFRGKQTWAFAHYGVPIQADVRHKVPAIVLVHGALGTAYASWVATWVQRGYAAICVDTCGALPVRTAEGTWLRNPEGGPAGWGRLDAVDEPVNEQWMHHAVAAVVRSHSFIRSLPEVDDSCVGITGISWGAVLACVVASIDNRFAYAIPVYGCGFNCTSPDGIMVRGENSGRPDASRKWFDLWDPAVYLSRAECPFLWVDGTNDHAFRLESVHRSADLVQGPGAFTTITRMVHSHGVYGENPPEILAFADHYARGGADIVRFTRVESVHGRLTAGFAANGRTISRAELVYTEDDAIVPSADRYWKTLCVERFDATSGIVSIAVPPAARLHFLNLVTYDGLVFSSRLFAVELAEARVAEVRKGRLD